MKIHNLTRSAVLAVTVGLALAGGGVITVVARDAGENPHAYFDALVSRADHWKSYSLRDQAQLARPKDGGYAHSNSAPLAVTYDLANDPDPSRQDAAKVVIPAFSSWRTDMLVTEVGSHDLVLQLGNQNGDVTRVSTSMNVKGMVIKLGDEYMVAISDAFPLDRATGLYRLASRGALGSTPRSHSAGTTIQVAVNSLANMVRLPLGTEDGYTYLFTWDTYHTDSYLFPGTGNHKAFQFSSGGDRIWLEPQTRFDGGPGNLRPAAFDPAAHVAAINVRSYNLVGGAADWTATAGDNFLGPGVIHKEPVQPMSGSFIIHPNRWVRWWVRIEQRANDYDLMDMWAADEQQNVVQLYSQIPLSVRANSIDKFWLEFNTSTSGHRRGDLRDLVAYVRNFVALRNPPKDISGLLLRPAAGAPNTETLSAPRNLRVVGGGDLMM